LGFFQSQSEEKIYQTQNRTHDVPAEDDEEDEIFLWMHGVADGVRTHDNRHHNPAERMAEVTEGLLRAKKTFLSQHAPNKNPCVARTENVHR
jgi:hypothetical protein